MSLPKLLPDHVWRCACGLLGAGQQFSKVLQILKPQVMNSVAIMVEVLFSHGVKEEEADDDARGISAEPMMLASGVCNRVFASIPSKTVDLRVPLVMIIMAPRWNSKSSLLWPMDDGM